MSRGVADTRRVLGLPAVPIATVNSFVENGVYFNACPFYYIQAQLNELDILLLMYY